MFSLFWVFLASLELFEFANLALELLVIDGACKPLVLFSYMLLYQMREIKNTNSKYVNAFDYQWPVELVWDVKVKVTSIKFWNWIFNMNIAGAQYELFFPKLNVHKVHIPGISYINIHIFPEFTKLNGFWSM